MHTPQSPIHAVFSTSDLTADLRNSLLRTAPNHAPRVEGYVTYRSDHVGTFMLAVRANRATATVDLLVVDPDATAQELDRPGFSLRLANNAETAIRLLERTLPHVLVLDPVLPDRDGLDLCQAAISSHTRPHVLVTTGAVERIPAALRLGCDSVLVKPYEPNLLFTRIGRLLRCGLHPNVTAGGRQSRGRFVGPGNTGTNRLWPTLECPGCHHEGSVSFDYASYRRMWCACLACNHVWVAARRE